MMDSIAGMATALQSSQLMADYSLSVTKMAMNTQEQLATDMVEMMNQAAPTIPKGQYIDVYA